MKAILLVRVSTEQQSLENQRDELIAMAMRDGYPRADLEVVENHESGVELDEEERAGLNKMKELIETGEFNAVYVWELSRLARRPKVLYSIKEYLQDRKIQLNIKEPRVSLLTASGEPDPGAELVFSLYATLSEQEGRNRKARFKRAKTAGALESRYSGGPRVRFGYEVVDGKYVVSESEAETVRLIYRLYMDGYGMDRIRGELLERGIVKSDGTPLSRKLIGRILSSKAYVGEVVNEWGMDRRYPQIISSEAHSEAQEQKKANSNLNMGENFDWRLCKKLITCPECGRHFVWWRRIKSEGRALGSYSCVGKDPRKYIVPAKCTNSLCINDIWIESLALQLSVYREALRLTKQNADEKARVQESIKELRQKIAKTNKEIALADSAMARVSEMYFKGYIDHDKMEDMNSRASQNKKSAQKKLSELSDQLLRFEEMLQAASGDIDMTKRGGFEEGIYSWPAEKQYQLVHRHIRDIRIYDDRMPFPGITTQETYRARRIEVEFFSGEKDSFWFYGSLGSRRPGLSPFTTMRDGELINYIVLKLR